MAGPRTISTVLVAVSVQETHASYDSICIICTYL